MTSEAAEEHHTTSAPTTARWWWPATAAVMAAGLGVRAGFVLIRQKNVELVTGDAYWYHFQAKLVADGRGFLNPFDYFKNGIESPGADHPPGFVLVLAALDVVGIDTPQRQRLVMCVVGTVSIAVVALLARRLAGARAGIIAACIAAFYPNFWINDGMLMVETIFILSVAVALLLCHRIIDAPARREVIWLSVCLTVACMHRPEALVLFPILLLPLVLTRRAWDLRRQVVIIGLAAAVPIAAFAPWAVYNLDRFDEPVLLSTGAGQTMAVGNCDLTYHGRFIGFYDLGCLSDTHIDPPTSQDASVRDLEYRSIAADYITGNLDDLPRVVAARVGRIWHVYRVGQQARLDAFIEGRGGNFEVRTALAGYYVLVPFAIGGLVMLRRRAQPVLPLVSMIVLTTFVAAISFGVTRYRAGAEITLAVAAAVAADALLRRWWDHRSAP